MPDASRILGKLLSTNTKADLLTLFNRNPNLSGRPERIAKRIGRAPSDISRDLDDLVEIGIISKRKVHGSELIRFDKNRAEEIQRILSKYIEKTLE